jgi:hypothetical protein
VKLSLNHNSVLPRVRLNPLFRSWELRTALAVHESFQSCKALQNEEHVTAGIKSRLVLSFIRAVGHGGGTSI